MSDAAVFLRLLRRAMRLPEGNPRGGNESSAFTGNLYSLTTKATASALNPHSCNYCMGSVCTLYHKQTSKHRHPRSQALMYIVILAQ